MPQVVEKPIGTREPGPNRIRWTRAQCEAIREAGVLTGNYELIDGEILSKMGHKPPHAVALTYVLDYLVATYGARFVRLQTSIDLQNADALYNEPEPDAAVTTSPASAYENRHPGPSDLALLVEVADTSLAFDLTTKAELYARAGIQDYWVLDLRGRRLVVHRHPTGEQYGEVVAYLPEESVAPLSRLASSVQVSALLPAPVASDVR